MRAHELIVAEARARRPLESGGILMGYWLRPGEVVITTATRPGREAQHYRSRYEPDAQHDAEAIARSYAASGRLHTYLGDWHSHPDAAPRPSRLDRATMAVIARHADARAAVPVMLIVRPSEATSMSVWTRTHRARVLPPAVGEMGIRLFECEAPEGP